MKKPTFLLPIPRLLTRSDGDAYEAIPFQPRESYGDEDSPALASPTPWNAEAVAIMAEGAACAKAPANLRAIEENTVPSWLWQKRARGNRRVAEGDLRLIFDRAVGSAAARGWKLGLFSSEKHARAFYDEVRAALMHRQIAIVPEVMANWGLSWAYGIKTKTVPQNQTTPSVTSLSNASIDALIGTARHAASAPWKKLFKANARETSQVTLRLSDITAEWQSGAPNPARALIDVMALRHNDGRLNIDALRQAARLLTILLDLQDRPDVTIGLGNLAPLLLALGLGYDSDAGRAMAASIAALVTAECYAASAEMAALRGPSAQFIEQHEGIMRSLRNHCRAAHGDGNDYEKLSVLPAPLPLKHCPDLALAAETQRRWDETVADAKAFGLRAIQVTDLTPSPLLALLMTSTTQGLDPMPRLTCLQSGEGDIYRQMTHPAVNEALTRLDYSPPVIRDASAHIGGTLSLRCAPSINHASLIAAGLDTVAIEKIEAYLPCVTDIGLALTPWIIGISYCRTHLKIPARKLESPRFDLLRHLGFSEEERRSANLHCYGHGTARNAKMVQLRHRPLFACGAEISVEARLRMAASLQSFVSGDTGIRATLPATQSVERGSEVTLFAWRRGLKSLTLVFDPTMAPKTIRKTPTARRIKPALHAHAQPMPKLARRSAQGKKAAPIRTGKVAERRTRVH